MLMKLYYMPGACSMAGHIVLEWIGAPYQTHQLERETLHSSDYLKLNPAGKEPALVIEDE